MRKIEIGKSYRHFKGDKITVLDVIKHSETLEELVLYDHNDQIWARPLSSFLSEEDVSKRSDNKTGQNRRFEEIEEE